MLRIGQERPQEGGACNKVGMREGGGEREKDLVKEGGREGVRRDLTKIFK